MRKYVWTACVCFLFLFLAADRALVQEAPGKVPPVPEIVYSDAEQLPPQAQAIVDQIRYYRSIGDTGKAEDLWRQLEPFINYAPEVLETGDKIDNGIVRDTYDQVERGEPLDGWWSSDPYIYITTNHEKSTSLEVINGHGTYNPNMYVAAEKWAGFTNPDNIILKRSSDHGTSWPSTAAYQKEIDNSGFQLSTPKMKQILPDYLGIVFARRYSSTDYDIHFVKQKWDFSTSTYLYPDNTSGTYHHRPDMVSDYETYGSGAYIYIVYWNGSAPTSLLLRRSMDGGTTWGAAITVATFDANSRSAYPHCSIDYDNYNLYIAFSRRVWNGSAYIESVAVTKSTNDGGAWSTPVFISSVSAAAYYPSVAASGNTVVVAYEYPYGPGDKDIRYSHSTNAGSTWTTNLSLASGYANEFLPIARSYAGVGSYIYFAYNRGTTEVVIRRTTAASPGSIYDLGNVKNSTKALPANDIPGLVPKLTNAGYMTGVAASWAQYYDSYYGFDLCFDASWQDCRPATFTYVSPADNATGVPITAILDWNASSGATSYDVYFGTSATPPLVTTTTGTSWDPPGSLANLTHYYWRIVAKNACGTYSGPNYDFTTVASAVLPTVTTTAVTSITALTAVGGGNVTSSGGASVTARGVCWNTSINPTFAHPHTSNGTGTGTFSSNITGLKPNTHYYVRAYATNSLGTAYGANQEFTTAAWIQIPGTLVDLVVGDFNNDGKDDLVGLNSAGAAYITTNRTTWTAIPGGHSFSNLVVGDFNNNGTDDLAGVTAARAVYYTTNLSTWTNIPGTLVSLAVGDFNNDGFDDLAGRNSAGSIYYTTNLSTPWVGIPGTMASFAVGDFNNDGADDLGGLNALGWIYYTVNRATWTRILGSMGYLATGDFLITGADDLAGLNSLGWIYYTTNLSTWTRISGGLAQLVVGDFNNTGTDKLAGLNSLGWIFYTTNLSTWTRYPGILSKLVAGDFNGDGKDELAGLNSAGSVFYTLF